MGSNVDHFDGKVSKVMLDGLLVMEDLDECCGEARLV